MEDNQITTIAQQINGIIKYTINKYKDDAVGIVANLKEFKSHLESDLKVMQSNLIGFEGGVITAEQVKLEGNIESHYEILGLFNMFFDDFLTNKKEKETEENLKSIENEKYNNTKQ